MLIRFFVENFLSFNDQVEFSMIPGKGRLLSHHVIRDKKRSGINSLKFAIIYGANASGKSNLIKAIDFAQYLILKGTSAKDRIQVRHFRLDKKRYKEPSKFQFDIRYKEKMYSYGFTLDSNKIHNEWLYEINKFRERLLFERKTTKENKGNIKFGNIPFLEKKERKFLDFVWLGTRPNQLFLTESIQRNVKYFKDVYEWFDRKLTLIFPETMAAGTEFYFDQKSSSSKAFLKYLQLFDTGISGLTAKRHSLEKNKTEIPQSVINSINEGIKNKNDRFLLTSPENKRYTVYRDEHDKLIALELIAKHKIINSDEKVNFDIQEESDGTQRLIDLLPALISSLDYDKVFLIDEFDRSLHPLLIKDYIKIFFGQSRGQKSQLIVTTHDSSLLNLKLLRKDEIWFIEKNQNGESKLYSLEEFKPRHDKDIQKSYLQGRLGAIPFIRDIKQITEK